MYQRAYYSSLGLDCKNLLSDIAIIKNIHYHVKKLCLNHSYFPHWGVWSMDSCLRSPTLSQVYLSLTFQLSQTAVVEVGMSYTFPTVPINLTNSQLEFFNEKFMCAVSRKEVGNCFAISLRFRFAIQFETRLETCLQWLLQSMQLEETEQLITMPVKPFFTCVSLSLAWVCTPYLYYLCYPFFTCVYGSLFWP